MSRSVTVAIAYIMTVTNLNWKDSLKVVRVGRSVANPNLGFQKQLQEFEATKLTEERRRLKERFPSLALQDEEQCRLLLVSYQDLLEAKDICEGNCTRGETCPTGMCRAPSTKRTIRRKPSTTSLHTPPQSPRLLPPTPRPGGASLARSSSTVSTLTLSPNTSRRPKSGPAGLHSYTGSCPPSRSQSRMDVTELPPGVMMEDLHRSFRSSAPNTPHSTPPVSPHNWPRRASTLTKRTISSAQLTKATH